MSVINNFSGTLVFLTMQLFSKRIAEKNNQMAYKFLVLSVVNLSFASTLADTLP